MKLPQKLREQLAGYINPYIKRYCSDEYKPSVKKLLAKVTSSELILPSAQTSIHTIVSSPHTLAYDNKSVISNGIKQVLAGKTEDFKNNFYLNILELLRGSSLDILKRADIENYFKIVYCRFVINLIDNISVISGLKLDKYIKIKDYLQTQVGELDKAVQQQASEGRVTVAGHNLGKIQWKKSKEELLAKIGKAIEDGIIDNEKEVSIEKLAFSCFSILNDTTDFNRVLKFGCEEKNVLLFFADLIKDKCINYSVFNTDLFKKICHLCVNRNGKRFKVKQLQTVVSNFQISPNNIS